MDQTIECSDCGATFVFAEAEQAFYASKGMVPPKRCRACRRARKADPSRERGPLSSRGPSSFPPSGPRSDAPGSARASRPSQTSLERPRFDITCSECGHAAQVPFRPVEGRHVYCQACYRVRKGSERIATDGLEVSESERGIVE